MSKEKILKVNPKKLDIEIGNLKIITRNKDVLNRKGSVSITGQDVDVYFDGKHFTETSLRMLTGINIDISSDKLIEVNLRYVPFVERIKK